MSMFKKLKKKLYMRKVWEMCEMLPLSDKDLRALGIADLPSPEEKMVDWWVFIASNILWNAYFDWSTELTKELSEYLCYHADVAASQFWGTQEVPIDQAVLLKQVWQEIGFYEHFTGSYAGHLPELKEAILKTIRSEMISSDQSGIQYLGTKRH